MQLIRAVMVPREAFAQIPPLPANAYDDPKMWIARPDIVKDNPALWTPEGVKDVQAPAKAPEKAAIFFIHTTSYIPTMCDALWNRRMHDKETTATPTPCVQSQEAAIHHAGTH